MPQTRFFKKVTGNFAVEKTGAKSAIRKPETAMYRCLQAQNALFWRIYGVYWGFLGY
jgi:hypothetical protein